MDRALRSDNFELSQKRTNEFVVVVKTDSFFRFLGEFEDTKSPFEIIGPLSTPDMIYI